MGDRPRDIADTLLTLPAHLLVRLANALETGLLAPPYSDMAIRSTIGNACVEPVLNMLQEWTRMGVSPDAAAAWLRSLDYATQKVQAPDFVWTGPELAGLHARDTRRVYEDLISSAKRSIWLCTYAFFDGPQAFATLATHMDTVPELDVTLLLNIQRGRRDTTSPESLVRRFTETFWTRDWPGKAQPSVYYDPRSVAVAGPSGVLHAKAAVVDDESVFVTSANLTEAAFDRNIELGLVVRDRTLAATTLMHFRTLIEKKLLRRLPTS